MDKTLLSGSEVPLPAKTYGEIPDEGIDLLDIAMVLVRGRRLILISAVSAALIMAVVSLFWPASYTATVHLLPPQQSESTMSTVLGQLGSLAGVASPELGLKNPNDIYVAMLRSRTIADALIRRFDLQKVYAKKRMTDVRNRLGNNTVVDSGKDQIITIAVEDRDPQRAADLANAYVEELRKLTEVLAVTEASQRRIFFERQLEGERDKLSAAEAALRKTEETTGIVHPDVQAKGLVDSISRLEAEVSAKEIQVRSMSLFATAQNPDYLRAQAELASLRQQLNKLQSTSGEPAQLGMKNLPAAGIEYIRKLRDLKYHESLMELLSKQYEAARIDESKQAAIVQVLDPAIPPESRTSPRRVSWTLTAGILGMLAAGLLCFMREGYSRLAKNPRHQARLEWLQNEFKYSR